MTFADLVKSDKSLIVVPICINYLRRNKMPGMNNHQYVFSHLGDSSSLLLQEHL